MKYFWLLLALAMTCLIFFNSAQTMMVSGKLSGWAAQVVYSVSGVLQLHLSGNVEHTIRKLAHFCEFAVLAWLWCQTFAYFHAGNRMANGYVLLFCLLTAVIDEYIQLSSMGRSSQVSDVLLDFSGSFCMWLGCRIWQWSR